MVHRRKTAIVLASVLLLVTSGIAMAAGTVIDDFEGNDISEWSGATGAYTTSGTDPIEGNYSLVTSSCFENCGLYQDIGSKPDQFSVFFRPTSYDTDGDEYLIGFGVTGDSASSSSKPFVKIDSNGNIIAGTFSGKTGGLDTGIDAPLDTTYRYVFDINYTSETFDLTVTTKTGNVVGKESDISFTDDISTPQAYFSHDDGSYKADYVGMNGIDNPYKPKYNVSGRVRDKDTNDYLSGATVEVYDGSTLVNSDTTNSIGEYDVGGLENGTYTMWVNKTGYQNENRTITVDGSDQTQNFKLASFNASIELRTKRYLPHGETGDYSVIVTVDGDRMNVTGEATVTSGNTSVVTVDSQAFQIVATSNIEVNDRTTLTATWTDSNGNEYTTTKNVTVANATVENLEILPTWTRTSASLNDKTLQLIIVATMVGAGAAALASSFAGLSASTGIVVLGWFAGYTSDGMLIVSFLFAIFVGLNLSQNTTIMSRPGNGSG